MCFRRRCCAALAGGSAAACVRSHGPQASTRTGAAARARRCARAGRRWRRRRRSAGPAALLARDLLGVVPALLFCADAAVAPTAPAHERRSLDERLGPAPVGAGAGGRRGSWPLRAAVDGGKARTAPVDSRRSSVDDDDAESETPPGQSRATADNRRRRSSTALTGTRLRPRRMEVSAESQEPFDDVDSLAATYDSGGGVGLKLVDAEASLRRDHLQASAQLRRRNSSARNSPARNSARNSFGAQ